MNPSLELLVEQYTYYIDIRSVLISDFHALQTSFPDY
jgi:hypothetical protein